MSDFGGKKRSELPDNVFGIPQERKYPMPDEKHTRSAIKLFNHVEPKYEEQLAKAIIKNMKKYNIDGSVVGPNNRLRDYLPKDMIKEYVEEACKDLIHARKLCNAVRKLARKYNANYFFVTDGASSYSNGNGKYNPAAKEMRDHMDDWERNNGFNPDDDWTDNINNVSNYRLLKESSIPEEIPKDIRELLRRLNSYDYGYIKNGQKIKGTKNFFEDYKSLTISEFEKYQIGVCWDYVHYEAYWFSKNKYKYETFYIQVQDEDNDCPSHTYLVFYLPNSSKVYYFESSWGKYQGIEAFDNINKLHDTIKERHIESARSKCDPKTYFRNKYDAKSSRWEHLSCGDYMVKVSNGKVQVNESMISITEKAKYDPPYTAEEVKRVYGTKVYKELRKDPAHKYRMDTGIELIHREPTKEELERIWKNWNLMSDDQKMKSDKKSIELFGKTNQDHYKELINSYTVNESVSILPQDTGISTVIFDIGDVLVSANIRDYLVADPEVPNEIVDELLKLWFIDKDEVDDTMDLDTYREIVNKRMGVEFSKYIPKLFKYNVDCVTAFDYTIPMIQDLKNKGYKVYYLSNWSAWTHDLLQEAGKFDFLKLMDGGVFSYDAGYMKPDEEIYKILLNKYKINPEEAMFFDDREENIEAANKLGIHGVHFPRHDSSIVYKNLFGYKLAKSIYEDINNIPYDFEPGRELEATYKLFLETNSMAITLQYEASKKLMKIIKPVILEDKEFKNRAKELHLTLKCKLLPVKGSVISVLVLDGSQVYRDTPDARKLLNDVRASCIMIINKLSGLLKKYISKIDIGDGDEGCLYFHLNKVKAIVHDLKNKVVKEEEMDFPNVPIIFDNLDDENLTVNIQESLIEMAKREGIPVSIKDGNDIFEYYPPTKEKPYGEIGGVSISRGDFNESSISEYGTTGGTIVGSNQPDSVYIVNYMQNNAFSGHKEPKFGVCRKGMKDLHIVGGKYNRFHYVSDLDKFKEEVSDIHVYRYKGKPKNEFFDIIEEMKDDNDLDLYKLITGREIKDRSEIQFDGDFIEEECFFDTIDAIRACTEAGLLEASTDLHPVPILTETVQGRPYNYYRDLNGVFIQHEITGLRSKSYDTLDDIPDAETEIVKRGYLV